MDKMEDGIQEKSKRKNDGNFVDVKLVKNVNKCCFLFSVEGYVELIITITITL
jgi:hypothetical protein